MENKWKRWPNQYRILEDENSLTEGAEQLISLIKKYQYTHNVTNQQYAYLMGISLRNCVKYVSELIEKGRLQVEPANRRPGRGRACKYRVIELSQ
jgi:DNA-binding transcriptional regulator LsrR (DeoR family)